MEILACYIDANGIESKNIVKYPYFTGNKNCEISIRDAQMILGKENTRPTLVSTSVREVLHGWELG